MQEALTCVKGISNKYKNSTLSVISTELAKQGKVEEALTCVRDMSDESYKSRAFSGISSELAKQGKFEEAASAMQEALTCAKGISDESDKSRALSGISSELAKQGKVEEAASAMQEALTCARGISDKSYKSSVLSRISSELAKQGNWALAETTGLEIPKLAQRHSCWKTIAEISYKIDGWEEALVQVNHLKSDEARLFYLKGLTEVVNEQDVNAVCVQESLSQLANDSESIENLLQKLSVNELFFNNEDKEKINRLNRILNFQWAIDIKAQFPEEDSSKKMSTNIEVWINDITDEDDREQIQLWAKQLAKGKITDENFREKVKGWL
jgi:tetratricopeptide (TPR) repeat protein